MKKHIITFCLALLAFGAFAQHKNQNQLVRIAVIEVDSTQLEAYTQELNLEIATSLKIEKGVKVLYAMANKIKPNEITIIEIYQDKEAYHTHIKTPHFLRYKTNTQNIVKSLKLIDLNPLDKEKNLKLK